MPSDSECARFAREELHYPTKISKFNNGYERCDAKTKYID